MQPIKNETTMTKPKERKLARTAFGQPGGNDPAVGAARRFGQPNGNPQCPGSIAANQREFYRWVESKATKAELEAYAADESKPAMRRQFVTACLNAINAQDPQLYFDLTNQTHGQPKQVVEQTTLPEVVVVLE